MTASSIIPGLVYNDAPAAIEWLCKAFGFKKHLVVLDNGVVHHAELTLGKAMVMLGSVKNGNAYSKLVRSPKELEFQSQSPYLVVDDPDSIYASAKRNCAHMVIDISDKDHGGRDFTCADLEGHLWSFGSYDPWAHPPQEG